MAEIVFLPIYMAMQKVIYGYFSHATSHYLLFIAFRSWILMQIKTLQQNMKRSIINAERITGHTELMVWWLTRSYTQLSCNAEWGFCKTRVWLRLPCFRGWHRWKRFFTSPMMTNTPVILNMIRNMRIRKWTQFR